MKWYPFDDRKGYHQKRPPERKDVLVILENTSVGLPRSIAVGYMKNSAGQKAYPYFVIPGIGGCVVAWCDCLPDGFFDSILPYMREVAPVDKEYWYEKADKIISKLPELKELSYEGMERCRTFGLNSEPIPIGHVEWICQKQVDSCNEQLGRK